MNDIARKLQEPFHASEIEWRVGPTNAEKTQGIALAYVTNRAIQNRLDELFGPFGWKNEYQPWKADAQLCGISILEEDVWVTKWDGAEDSDMESVKGGLSDAMKRAAYQWGIGRYLYKLPAQWMPIKKQGKSYVLAKTPALPKWALPGGQQPAENEPEEETAPEETAPEESVDINEGKEVFPDSEEKEKPDNVRDISSTSKDKSKPKKKYDVKGDVRPINEKQIKLFYAITKGDKALMSSLAKEKGFDDLKDITREAFDDILVKAKRAMEEETPPITDEDVPF